MTHLKLFRKSIPSFRHRKVYDIIDQSFRFNPQSPSKHNNNLIKRTKRLYTLRHFNLNMRLLKYTTVITHKLHYQFRPLKKFITCQTVHGFNLVVPGVEFLNIGKILYNYNHINSLKNSTLFNGFIAKLNDIPLTVIFSNVTNHNNNKITYAKSAGTFCQIWRGKKTKKKLIQITLPSQKLIFLPTLNKAYVGRNSDFCTPQLVEGKFGHGFHPYKKLNVRGVAMNPVDHPNGGRTKTVQPERSPWGWIAKKKK